MKDEGRPLAGWGRCRPDEGRAGAEEEPSPDRHGRVTSLEIDARLARFVLDALDTRVHDGELHLEILEGALALADIAGIGAPCAVAGITIGPFVEEGIGPLDFRVPPIQLRLDDPSLLLEQIHPAIENLRILVDLGRENRLR